MRPIIAIVGATATGKSALAVALAATLDGEIINADSRQVYRGMDIGTAKPTAEEQSDARHWLVDVVAPDQQFTLASFLEGAGHAIADMESRAKRPIIAGGTGQYVWALLEGWRVPRVPPDRMLRARLEETLAREGTSALMDELRAIDRESAETIDARNPRRVIRAIEVTLATGRPFSSWRTKHAPPPSIILGLRMDRAALYRRIDRRVDRMMAAGLVDEVVRLNRSGYGCNLPSMSGIGYRQICEYAAGDSTLDEAVARIKTETHRLARMQHAWFRASDPRITWLEADAPDLVERASNLASGQALPGGR